MVDSDFDKFNLKKKLRITLVKDIRTVCQEAGELLKLEFHEQAVQLIAELAWKKLQFYGTDLEQFAKHAKRSTVNSDDVRLLVRRNEKLKEYINLIAAKGISTNGSKHRNEASSSTVDLGNFREVRENNSNFGENEENDPTVRPIALNIRHNEDPNSRVQPMALNIRDNGEIDATIRPRNFNNRHLDDDDDDDDMEGPIDLT